jgi:hypothetical protein
MPIPKNKAARDAWIMIGLGLVFVLIGGFVAYLSSSGFCVGTFGWL